MTKFSQYLIAIPLAAVVALIAYTILIIVDEIRHGRDE